MLQEERADYEPNTSDAPDATELVGSTYSMILLFNVYRNGGSTATKRRCRTSGGSAKPACCLKRGTLAIQVIIDLL